jgi:hypothetical protein
MVIDLTFFQCLGAPLHTIVPTRPGAGGSQNVTEITLVATLSGVADKNARNRYHRAPAQGQLTRKVL